MQSSLNAFALARIPGLTYSYLPLLPSLQNFGVFSGGMGNHWLSEVEVCFLLSLRASFQTCCQCVAVHISFYIANVLLAHDI